MTTILVDIDGVLAAQNFKYWVVFCNDTIQLEIEPDVLKCVRSTGDFHALPQAQAHRAKVGDEMYRRQMAMIDFLPQYVLQCNLITGALQGVRYLSERCQALKYCTARCINFNDQWNSDLVNSTWRWLANNDFPYTHDIIFCDGVKSKLETIAGMLRSYAHPILLIDDSVDLLVKRYAQISEEDQRIVSQYLTLAAFGYDAYEQESPFPIIPFPGWRESHNLVVNQPMVKEVFP